MDNKTGDVKMASSAPIDNKEIEQAKHSETTVKKSVKEEKSRKKDDKSVEQVLKALNSLDTTEEKLAAMCKKYSDIVDENRKLQLTVKQSEKRFSMIQREKEQLQTEHSKAVLTRSRLESLCRELQRQNKAIKDESLLKIREEEEKRKEVSAKFQSTLNEITALMQQNNEKNSKLREDNLEMTKKFKTVCEQYELREQQVEKITKQMQLEAQLADAKLAKAKMEMAAEKEVLLKEKQQLLMDLTEYQAKCQELQTTEVNLRSQISLYTDKYDEFQNALSRSNEVFGGFKGEMEKMSKKICKLEKETSSWKQRWEKSHQALLEMAADKQQRDGELALATRQLAQLQKLCRTLQAERTSLLAQLRSEGMNKDNETTVKAGVPFETLQAAQDAMACPLSTVHSEPCKHEIKNPASVQNLYENCQNTQNPLTDLILNVNVEQAPTNQPTDLTAIEKSNSIDNKEDESNTVTPVVDAKEQIETSPHLIQSAPTRAEVPVISNTQVPVNKPISNEPKSEVNTVPSPVNESTEEKSLSKETKSEINSLVTQVIDQISTKEDTVVSQDTSVSVVNGQIPVSNSSEVKNILDGSTEKSNTTVEVNVANGNANQVAPNQVIEQIPVKSSPVENKKGKEGAKKRKNK